MPHVFLSAGEPSGVNIGATLMRTLKERRDDLTFAGLGGDAMVAEGFHRIYDPATTATMWLWGNLKRIPAHRRARDASIAHWEEHRPAVVVTIDYQAFHLYLGRAARERGIPVVHFVSSQFWGRRYFTLEPTRRAYSHVLCIHEFEKRHYDEAGIPATYVGHPLFERLAARTLDEGTMDAIGALDGPARLGILPGSRGAEIRHCLPVLLGAAARLRPTPHLVVSSAHPASDAFLREQVEASGLPATIVEQSSGEILSRVDAAFITSGSASMEAVWYGCPCAVVYVLSPLSYFFGKPQIACDIAQPNLVAGRRVVPEFLLPGTRGLHRAAAAMQHLLDEPQAREAQREAFAAIRERLLAGPRPSRVAADVIESYLDGGGGEEGERARLGGERADRAGAN